jgi:hypothetical protein
MNVSTLAVKVVDAQKYLLNDAFRNEHGEYLVWLGESEGHVRA